MGEHELLARQQSVAGGETEISREPANALEGPNRTALLGKAPATAPDIVIVVDENGNQTRGTVAARSGVLETAAAAGTEDQRTRAVTTSTQVKAATICARPVAESTAGTAEQQPACDVALDAAASPAELETSNMGDSNNTKYPFGGRHHSNTSPKGAMESYLGVISSKKVLPMSGAASAAVADTAVSARAIIERVAATALSTVSERAVKSLTNASDIHTAAESHGSIRAAVQAIVEYEAGKSPSSLTAIDVASSSAAAPPPEATRWGQEAALAAGGADEAEKEFQALSPIRRFLAREQQQKEHELKQERTRDDQEQQAQQQQESYNTTLSFPGLATFRNAKAGQQFPQPSAVSPLQDLQQQSEVKGEVPAKRVSIHDVPVFSTAVEDDVLPAFANEENQKLHAEIQTMRKGLLHVTAKIAEREERTQMLSEHLKHVLLELQQTSRIAAAKKESIRTEEHMAALRQRHASQLQKHAKNLAIRVDTYAEQLLSLNTEMAAGSARLDQFKLQMNWNAAELSQWSVAENQKQQDRLQVERLQRADEREVKTLTHNVEKLCSDTHRLREKLHQQTTHARGLHVELESAALQFNGLQQERLRLIEQWEAALECMQQRDEAIQHAAARYSVAQEEIEQKRVHFDSMQKFKSEQVAANEELHRELQQLEKAAVKLRGVLASIKSRLNLVNASGEELRTQLSATTTATAKTRKEIEHLQEQLERRKQQLASIKRRFTLSQKRIENELHRASSEDEAFKRVEAFCGQLEEDCKAMEKKLKRSRQMLFEEVQQHVAQQADNQATRAELNSSRAALRNLLTQLHKLDQDRQRQQELLYAVEFQSQVMQRKVARVAGYRGTAEKKQLTAKIEKLTQLLEQQKQQVQMLTTQLRRLDSELRKAQREQQVRHKEACSLTDILGDLRLECDSLRRDATDRQKEKESVYVEHDTLQLEVKKLHDQLRASNAAACAAEADKEQIQSHIEEEILEAENRLELVRTAARVAYEERHKLSLELASRKTKILNLESKYAVLVQKIKADDGEGVERSQAYYIIKAIQEKQDLQRVGDELDQKIRDAEQESRSLELTLQQLRQRNRNFKRSLNAERHSVQHERESRKDFEAQLIELHDRIYEQQQLAKGLKKEKQAEERRINETLQHFSVLSEKLEKFRGALRNSKQELTEQLEKLRRAERQHRKLCQVARAKKLLPERGSQNGVQGVCDGEAEECPFFYDPTRQSNIEMEPHLEGLKAHMQALLHSLAIVLRDGCASLPAAAHAVEEALAAQGLALPSRPISVVASSDGGRSVSGCSNGRSGSGSRLGESKLPSFSSGSSASSSPSVSHQQEGLLLCSGGVSSLKLSASHQLLRKTSRSGKTSIAFSAEGHSLAGDRVQEQSANRGRATTAEFPLSSVVKSTDCKMPSAEGFTTLTRAATDPSALFLQEASSASKRACTESAASSPERTTGG